MPLVAVATGSSTIKRQREVGAIVACTLDCFLSFRRSLGPVGVACSQDWRLGWLSQYAGTSWPGEVFFMSLVIGTKATGLPVYLLQLVQDIFHERNTILQVTVVW